VSRAQVRWTVVLVAVFGGLVFGAQGALVAGLVAAAVLVGRPDGARQAFVLISGAALLAAGVAALVETPLLKRWPVTFSLDRPVAAALAAVAGTALFAHLVVGVIGDRAREPHLLGRWHRIRVPVELVRDVLAVLAVVLVGVLLRSAGDVTDLPTGVTVVEANLEAGIGYATGVPADTAVAPLTPALLFVTGLGATALAGVAVAVIGLEAAELARRADRPAVIGATAGVLLPTVWGATLPVLLATALLGGAVLLIDRTVGERRRDLAAGALAAFATMADPTALAGAACLATWLLIRRRAPSRAARVAAPAAIAAVVLTVGFARLDGGPGWWGAGGDLATRPVWLVAIDLGIVLAGLATLSLRRADRSLAIELVAVCIAVATAHIGRDGSPSWVWAPLLLVALALTRGDGEAHGHEGGAGSSRSSSVTSRYHMSAQSTQR